MNRFLSEIQEKYTKLAKIVKISISFNRLVFPMNFNQKSTLDTTLSVKQPVTFTKHNEARPSVKQPVTFTKHNKVRPSVKQPVTPKMPNIQDSFRSTPTMKSPISQIKGGVKKLKTHTRNYFFHISPIPQTK